MGPKLYHAAMQSKEAALAQAYQHCMQIAQQHYENFPTASLLIRKELRPAVAAIYAFARAADDMADEGDAPAEKRLKQLEAWELLLERCVNEELDHPVFLALGDTVRRFSLNDGLLHDLLTAFRMDVTIHSYATFHELMFYCKHSANPVGRLVLALHDISEPEALRASDAICTALQLTNFWQDFRIDIPKGRCYLPEEWLQLADSSSEAVIAASADSESLKPALEKAFSETQSLFDEGYALLPYLPLRLRLQIAATLHGGQAILHATRCLQDPLRQRPELSRMQWIRLAGKILFTALFPAPKPALETT